MLTNRDSSSGTADFWRHVELRRLRHYTALGLLAVLSAVSLSCLQQANAATPSQAQASEMVAIRPGQPGVRPFWNSSSGRFIYPPAFDFSEVAGASKYRFRVLAGQREYVFTSAHPWDALAPIWTEIPEGFTELTVEGLDSQGTVTGVAGRREFYRSPGFPGPLPDPPMSYSEAGSLGLRALFIAEHVRHWLKPGGLDPEYTFYCYPAKVMGALVRAMAAYAELTPNSTERKEALLIAQRAADHLISTSMPEGTPFAFFPPTYSLDVREPKPAAKPAFRKHWMMTHYPCDAAFGYLDLFKLTREARYLAAARRIAETYVRTQGPDGTWPLVVNFETGKPEAPNRLVPTWVVFLFDRLEREQRIATFRPNRERAWQYIEKNPLQTFAWDAQFEDTKPRPPYQNLAREQACDTAAILFEHAGPDQARIETAKELLRFGEDQFIVWSPVADPDGWRKAKLERPRKTESWFTPAVLEQYTCYMPVARSSAVFIQAYLAAYKATGDSLYLQKARALGHSLVVAQQYQIQKQGGKGEIPTWVVRQPPGNWLNNSFYAAQALVELGRLEQNQARK